MTNKTVVTASSGARGRYHPAFSRNPPPQKKNEKRLTCTCICAVGVTSTSRGYWISSTEFRSDGTSGRAAERPSGQCTSTLVATSLPTVTHRFCEPQRIQNRQYVVLQDPSWVNSLLSSLPVLIRGVNSSPGASAARY